MQVSDLLPPVTLLQNKEVNSEMNKEVNSEMNKEVNGEANGENVETGRQDLLINKHTYSPEE